MLHIPSPYKILLISLLTLVHFSSKSQDKWSETQFIDTLNIFEDFFDCEEPISLTLKFDIKAYQKTRVSEEYQKAELIYEFNDSTSETHYVRLRTRGEFRKNYCTLPPFWLNLKNADVPLMDIGDVSKMKIVTHCKNSDIFGDYLLKEYLVYKMYNIISPYSFRVRLIRMKYIDTGRENKITEKWAFAIEPEEMVEKRLNASFIDNDMLAMATVNGAIMDRLALFQYMIGNGDYSVTGRHNLKILLLNDSGPTGNIPLPYDFDYTGFVNTTYAVPGENLGIKTVRERYFLGPCRSEEMHQEIIDELNAAERKILNLIQQFEYLSLKQKLDALSYIEDYYGAAASAKFINKYLKSTCR